MLLRPLPLYPLAGWRVFRYAPGVVRLRYILTWATFVILSALIVFSIVGAFLGANRAMLLFNSPPLNILWVLLAVLLAVGIFTWRRLWRCPGLLAIHVGLLLILAGGLWGSHHAHAWRGNMVGPGKAKTREGYMLLTPQRTPPMKSRQLWWWSDTEMPQRAGTLPFDVELRRAWREYYPPAQGEWKLLGLTYDAENHPRDVASLSGRIGQPGVFPAIQGTVTVLAYDHERRTMELAITQNGETFSNRIEAGPADSPAPLPLVGLFETPKAWQAAGRPEIAILPPRQVVRDYKAELAVTDAAGNDLAREVIEVNHPMHYRGYHFCLSNFHSPQTVVLKVVSDDGLYWVYAGFAAIMLGLILRLWGRGVLQALRTRASRESAQEAGHDG